MKTIYRGHEINVVREQSLGGWPILYWSIFRQSDALECASNFEDSAETVRSLTKLLKQRIDAELATPNPWNENETEEVGDDLSE